jgi:hypothetical protein
MPKMDLSDEQIVELILQLPPERQRAVLQMLSAARNAWWQRTIALRGSSQMRHLCAERGLNWDAMTEEERESFVDNLIHEYRACDP